MNPVSLRLYSSNLRTILQERTPSQTCCSLAACELALDGPTALDLYFFQRARACIFSIRDNCHVSACYRYAMDSVRAHYNRQYNRDASFPFIARSMPGGG